MRSVVCVALVLAVVVATAAALPLARRKHAEQTQSRSRASARAHERVLAATTSARSTFHARIRMRETQGELQCGAYKGLDGKVLANWPGRPANTKADLLVEDRHRATLVQSDKFAFADKGQFKWTDKAVFDSDKALVGVASAALQVPVKAMVDWATKNVQPQFTVMLERFARLENKAGRACRPVVAKPKSAEAAVGKIGRDYGGDPKMLIDGIRGTIVYKYPDDLVEGVCNFQKYLLDEAGMWHSISCAIPHHKNRWDKPLEGSEYKDFMATVSCEFGPQNDRRTFLLEVQFHQCSMLMAKQGDPTVLAAIMPDLKPAKNGHKLYEEYRTLAPTSNEAKLLVTQMKALNTEALKKSIANQCDLKLAPKWIKEEYAAAQKEAMEEVYSPDVATQPWNSKDVDFKLVGGPSKEELDKWNDNLAAIAAALKKDEENHKP